VVFFIAVVAEEDLRLGVFGVADLAGAAGADTDRFVIEAEITRRVDGRAELAAILGQRGRRWRRRRSRDYLRGGRGVLWRATWAALHGRRRFVVCCVRRVFERGTGGRRR